MCGGGKMRILEIIVRETVGRGPEAGITGANSCTSSSFAP